MYSLEHLNGEKQVSALLGETFEMSISHLEL